MAKMTEEEADYWDEQYTKNPPKVDPSKRGTGFFTRRTEAARTITVDNLSADYLTIKAMAAHKTPADIISDMIQKEIAAAL